MLNNAVDFNFCAHYIKISATKHSTTAHSTFITAQIGYHCTRKLYGIVNRAVYILLSFFNAVYYLIRKFVNQNLRH